MARRNVFRRIWEAIRNPETYAPPALPDVPPPFDPPSSLPSEPPFPRTEFIPAAELPAEWGRVEKALWQDATKISPELARDQAAQAYYNLALYTRSISTEEKNDYRDQFKNYIMRTYGINWDSIFDWREWRDRISP
jgi:hypothetical protein